MSKGSDIKPNVEKTFSEKNAGETGFRDEMREDAWGKLIELTPYLDFGWVLLSPGPDGRFDPEDEDADENADNVFEALWWPED